MLQQDMSDEDLILQQKEENDKYTQRIKTWLDLANLIQKIAPNQKKTFTKELRDTLKRENFCEPAAIQKMVLPYLFQENTQERFTYIKSPTGTGKTLSFILPQLFFFEEEYLQNFYETNGKLQYYPYSLILVSQHALLRQIKNDFDKVIPDSLKKKGFLVQHFDKKEEEQNINGHVLCGVPQTILKLIQQKLINLKNVKFVIVDEADNTIINDRNHLVKQILQRFIDEENMRWKVIVCGATIDMRQLKQYFTQQLRQPKSKEALQIPNFFDFKFFYFDILLDNIYHFYEDSAKNPDDMFRIMIEIIKNTLQNLDEAQIMIFFNLKQTLNEIIERVNQDYQLRFLVEKDLICDVQQQLDREKQQEIIDLFKEGKKKVMLCSDLMSRGMNFRKVRLVINFGIPRDDLNPKKGVSYFDMKRYDQRVGRTGRMEDLGVALTILNPNYMQRENYFEPEEIILTKLPENKCQLAKYEAQKFEKQLSEVYIRTRELQC